MRFLRCLATLLVAGGASVSSLLTNRPQIRSNAAEDAPSQDIVSWDEYSVMVRGERVLFFSGEFHPFRLPSPGLWLDVFQKIKAIGFTGVSFYTNWALHEGLKGEFRADGVFALEHFFEAAQEAGIYLLARPGPYINSEVAGGGFPGWASRIKGPVRSNTTDWMDATKTYIHEMGTIISRAQITNGGPVILFQPENEYTICADALEGAGPGGIGNLSDCLNPWYMEEVTQLWRETGIVIPYIINDALPVGNFLPGSGPGEAEIWGYDGYPLGWGVSCEDPTNWGRENALFPTSMHNFTLHMEMSPSSPCSIIEFQGGSAEPWGGAGIDACATLLNNDFAKVIYKTVYGFRVTILNLYMMFGGTNWGNLGHPRGYSSYDIGAPITENRLVSREKYSELKLQANFLQVSPAYQTSVSDDGTYGKYTDVYHLITVKLDAVNSTGAFYIVRHGDWTSQEHVDYKLQIEAGGNEVEIPQLGGHLTLNGRDAKIHVVNYDIGTTQLHYSSAEVLTWKNTSRGTILVLYGTAGETHEFAIPAEVGSLTMVEGEGIRYCRRNNAAVIQWEVEPTRRIVRLGDLEVHLLSRNEAYNYFVLDLPKPEPIGRYVSESRINDTDASVIVKAGYLLRNASFSDGNLYLWGDVNKTTIIEVIAPPIPAEATLFFNGEEVECVGRSEGRVTGTIEFKSPDISLPDFQSTEWRYMDAIPEVSDAFDDSLWLSADVANTNNTRNLTTPTSLYASDYGFHSGSLIYRGHFSATGEEENIFLSLSGGDASGSSVWLNSTHLGSWVGEGTTDIHNHTLNISDIVKAGSQYVITVLIDHMGLSMNTYIGEEEIKDPRGVLHYSFTGNASHNEVTWKLTGNIGGEDYLDLTRGPRNEGALFPERQGYHLPGAALADLESKSPLEHGVDGVGVGFFATTFSLDVPEGYDVPMSFVLAEKYHDFNSTEAEAFRVQLFVNGWQYGEYINNIGPQTSFPVPEGILNYNGENYIALTLWSMETSGVKLQNFELVADAVILSGYSKPALVKGAAYAKRQAY